MGDSTQIKKYQSGVRRTRSNTMKEKILTAITTYIQQHGYPPTVREIGEAVGLKSTSSVYHYLQRMDAAGIIALGNGPRAIRVPGWRFERIKKSAAEGTMRNATPEEQAAVRERRREHESKNGCQRI